ncbi:CinA family protein [Mesoplasma syrphidae]|uniref:CinA family protein n=1 Tax=Mesoplasma syrphidae TaxID=225999 RepID=A0A2K9C6L5_9MOLU|nr:CinA family protein [Mesoplasma syrphidae]AUF83927.1 CinA family protein [Mesoplasma syrphidae]
MNTNVKQIIEILKQRNLKISACESFTGGLFSSTFTDVAGASKVFVGSFICYSNEFKIKQIKIAKQVIKKYGVISQECAEAMAFKTNKKLKTNLCVSFTGNAGPSSFENQPVGLSYITIYYLGKQWTFKFFKPNLTRERYKQEAVAFVLTKIIEILQ